MSRAPDTIRTARLLLRRPRAADAAAIFERYAADPEVTRYLAWPTHQTLADTERFLAFSEALWTETPAGAFLIESRDQGILIGSTGLTFASPTEAETGYVLARDYWGLGFASEALKAMVELAPTVGVRLLFAHCHPDHRASWRVLEKAGFTRDPQLHEHPGFPNLPGSGPTLVLRYTLQLAPAQNETRNSP